jgi:hypothetical protein
MSSGVRVKSGILNIVWIEYCVKNMNILIIPIQVKNCTTQIFPTSGDDLKKLSKLVTNTADFYFESFSFSSL